MDGKKYISRYCNIKYTNYVAKFSNFDLLYYFGNYSSTNIASTMQHSSLAPIHSYLSRLFILISPWLNEEGDL